MSKGEQRDCIFCRILTANAKAEILHSDAHSVSILDISPVSRGHCLILPRTHYRDIFSLTADDAAAIAQHSVLLAAALRHVTGADGLAVQQFNGAAAGQTVFHYHVHLIPRHNNNQGAVSHGRRRASAEELAATATEIRAALIASNNH